MITDDVFEYYISVTFYSGDRTTLPSITPEENPFRINVRSMAVSESSGGVSIADGVVILTPQPNEVVRTREVLVAVSFTSSDIVEHDGQLQLFVDGVRRRSNVTIGERTLIARLRYYNSQQSRIELVKSVNGTSFLLASWNYEVRLSYSDEQRSITDVHGSVGTEALYQRINSDARRSAAGFGTLTMNYNGWDIGIQGRYTSVESRYLQPQHRYLVTMSNRTTQIRIGDVNPRYNELMLWGRRVRGFDVCTGYNRWTFQASYGSLIRAVEGRLLGIDTTWTESGEGIAGIDTSYSYGTYRRWMVATRIAYRSSQAFQIGVSLLKAKDARHSIHHGYKPKDNIASGIDLTWWLYERRLSLSSDVVISAYNDNISETTAWGYGAIRDIIWINIHSDPLPKDSTGSSAALANSMLRQAFSTHTRIRYRFSEHDVQLGYRKMNRGYHTLALPTLISDREGFYLRERYSVIPGRMQLNASVQYTWDNVLREADVTNKYVEMQAGFSFFTSPGMPDISMNYRFRNNYNDASRNLVIDTTSTGVLDTTFIDLRNENRTHFYTTTLSQRMFAFSANHDVNLNLTFMDRNDAYNDIGSVNQVLGSMMINSTYDAPLRTVLNVSRSNQQAAEGLSDLTFTSASFRFEYSLMNRTLVPHFTPRLTLGQGANSLNPFSPRQIYELSGADPDDPYIAAEIDTMNLSSPRYLHIDFTRIDWTAGLDFQISNKHLLRGYVSFTTNVDRGQYEYWNGARFDADIETVTNSDGETVVTFEQPSASIRRDDIVAMFSYTYRF